MSNPIRQHLVPRCYLKRFSKRNKDQYFLDLLEKENPQNNISTRNIKYVCVEKDFYTFSKLPDEHKYFLEKSFSKTIEADFDRLYPKLVSPKERTILNKERIALIHFVISQFFRTSKTVNNFNNFWDQMINVGYTQAQNQKGKKSFYIGEEEIDVTNKSFSELQKEQTQKNREYINFTTLTRTLDIVKQRLKDIISISKVHPSHYLISSDNPVHFIGHELNLDTLIKIPIDHEHILTILPYSQYSEMDNKEIARPETNFHFSELDCTYNNIAQIEHSEKIIFGKKEHIQDAMEKYNHFDINVFTAKAEKFTNTIEAAMDILNKLPLTKD
jgi:hypothetical protein